MKYCWSFLFDILIRSWLKLFCLKFLKLDKFNNLMEEFCVNLKKNKLNMKGGKWIISGLF